MFRHNTASHSGEITKKHRSLNSDKTGWNQTRGMVQRWHKKIFKSSGMTKNIGMTNLTWSKLKVH